MSSSHPLRAVSIRRDRASSPSAASQIHTGGFLGRLHRMGKTSLKPYGGARDRPGRWQSHPRRAQKGTARRGKRAKGVDTAEREKERLEATFHPRNVAHTGRSMRSAYVGGWGFLQCGERKNRGSCLGMVQKRFGRVIIFHVPTWCTG